MSEKASYTPEQVEALFYENMGKVDGINFVDEIKQGAAEGKSLFDCGLDSMDTMEFSLKLEDAFQMDGDEMSVIAGECGKPPLPINDLIQHIQDTLKAQGRLEEQPNAVVSPDDVETRKTGTDRKV